jgi:hypothetical protein
MELHELVAAVAAFVAGDEGKAKDVAQAIRRDDSTKAVATVLLNAGAGRKKGEAQQREKELADEITKLTEERDDLTAKVEAAASAPNERVAALERERDKYKSQAEKHKAEADAERLARKGDKVTGKAEAFVAAMIGSDVHPDYQEVLEARVQKRIQPLEDGSGIQVLDEDGTPMDGDEKAQLTSLRASVLKTVPDLMKLRPGMQPGGGAGRGSSGPAVTVEQIQREKAESGAYRL